jgi:hypothetical protein
LSCVPGATLLLQNVAVASRGPPPSFPSSMMQTSKATV